MLTLIWLHFLGDFPLQQIGGMAVKKGSSIKWLIAHVFMYSIGFFIAFGWKFGLANAMLHLVIDFCSSKATKYFNDKKNMSMFFTTIGFDQAIHFTCLILTYGYFFN